MGEASDIETDVPRRKRAKGVGEEASYRDAALFLKTYLNDWRRVLLFEVSCDVLRLDRLNTAVPDNIYNFESWN